MAQFVIDRAGQFAPAKDDFALLARHGGIKIAFVAERLIHHAANLGSAVRMGGGLFRSIFSETLYEFCASAIAETISADKSVSTGASQEIRRPIHQKRTFNGRLRPEPADRDTELLGTKQPLK